jgi:ribose transport system ATP-binding protein
MSVERSFVEMHRISKGFPGVQALDQVSFDLRPGEVHALVGENGAGKSTLVKILSGVYQPDEGEIILNGQRVTIRDPRHAQELGIAIVYQELNLFQNLSVAENLFGGQMPSFGLLGFEDRQAAYRTTIEYLKKFELPIDPGSPMRELSVAEKQVVEISRALVQRAQVLILDEPTSSLTERETKFLFKIIEQLKAEGLCIVYISHRLEEIFEIAERVTVLRDGQLIDTRPVATTNLEIVIRMMVGRELKDLYGQSGATRSDVILSAERLTSEGRFQDVSFELHAGEILGMAGMIGAGRSDVGLALFGAVPLNSGTIRVDGKRVDTNSPHTAMRLGIAYLSEDRRSDGLFLGMAVRPNITVTHLERYAKHGFLSQAAEAVGAEAFITALDIQTPSTEEQIMNLSGGNQQKVLLARWLAIEPQILIADEPTRGIDVGAKGEIYALLHRLAAQGVGIILISSEMPEVLGMSDRILVMHEGRITGELTSSEASEERIVALATNQALLSAEMEGKAHVQ